MRREIVFVVRLPSGLRVRRFAVLGAGGDHHVFGL